MVSKKEKTPWRVVVLAMVLISIVEVVALLCGFNGDILKIYIGTMCLLAGIVIPTPKLLRR